MDVRVVHCPACERAVRVAVPKDIIQWPPRGDAAADAVCFEHGATCTGELCPIFDVPPERMRVNLESFQQMTSGILEEEVQ